MDVLTTPWTANLSSQGTQTPRTLANHFTGDAMHDAPDGINTNPNTFNAVWRLYTTDCDMTIQFLRDHRGQVFQWAAPRDALRHWEATEWSRTAIDTDIDELSVTFEERFV
jgi:phage-related protein